MDLDVRLTKVFALDHSGLAVESGGVASSWGDIDNMRNRIASALADAGIPVGSRIGLLMRSASPHVAALLACVIGRWTVVSLNPLLPPGPLDGSIRSAELSVIIGSRNDFSEAIKAAAVEQSCGLLVIPSSPSEPAAWLEPPVKEKVLSQTLAPHVLIEISTSGTTGPPKRIPLLRSAFNESLRASTAYEAKSSSTIALRRGARILTAPLTHISGIWGMLTGLADGRTVVLLERFSVENWVSAIERHKARVASLPPAALRMILNAQIPPERLRSLVAMRAGTAPLEPEVIDEFMERYNLPVLQQYGATEFAGGVAGWRLDDFKRYHAQKRGSVGRIQSNIEARVVDSHSSRVLEANDIGVLELRGAQLGDAKKWVRTNDLARLDPDNFLWILGRSDNAINRGGFKINPDEVARAIELHPSVMEAVVCGVSDARLGEVPAAVVILRTGMPALTEQELIAFAKQRLLAYQVPVFIEFRDEIPRTQSLKPNGPEIRQLLENRLDIVREAKA